MKPARALLLITLLASSASLPRADALADDSPTFPNENAITSLTPEAARKLLVQKGDNLSLSLGSLKTLDSATAEVIAEFKGKVILLGGLTTLSADTARVLAAYDGMLLGLPRLTKLDAETATELAKSKCKLLGLQGLKTLSADTARQLAKYEGSVQVSGLTELDAATAGELAKFKCDKLSFACLKAFDPATAEALANFAGVLELGGITALDSPDAIVIAEALAASRNAVDLPNLEKVSPKTLMALVRNDSVLIPPVGTLELIPEPDGSLTEDCVMPQRFEERQAELRGRIFLVSPE
jgi:hypothetical protein